MPRFISSHRQGARRPRAGGVDLAQAASTSRGRRRPRAGGVDLAQAASTSRSRRRPRAGGVDLAQAASTSRRRRRPRAEASTSQAHRPHAGASTSRRCIDLARPPRGERWHGASRQVHRPRTTSSRRAMAWRKQSSHPFRSRWISSRRSRTRNVGRSPSTAPVTRHERLHVAMEALHQTPCDVHCRRSRGAFPRLQPRECW
jgi:hypothetical protein